MIYQNPKQMILESDIDIFDFENDPMTSMLESYSMDTYVLTEGSIKDVFERIRKYIKSIINFIAQKFLVISKKLKEKIKTFSNDDKFKLGIENFKRAGVKFQVYNHFHPNTLTKFTNEVSSKCDYSTDEYQQRFEKAIKNGDSKEIEFFININYEQEFYKYCPKSIKYGNIKGSINEAYHREDYTLQATDLAAFDNTTKTLSTQIDNACKLASTMQNELKTLELKLLAFSNQAIIKGTSAHLDLDPNAEKYDKADEAATKFAHLVQNKINLISYITNFILFASRDVTYVLHKIHMEVEKRYQDKINPGQIFNVGDPEDSAKNESTIFESVRFLNA